jgi:branched-chain amino acid transport system ATP-binding protein
VLGAISFVGLGADPSARVARSRRASAACSRSPAPSSAGRSWCCWTSRRRAARRGDPAPGEVIRAIPGHTGALAILVDHDMSLVSACCEMTAVLDFGKLIASGPDRRGCCETSRVIRAYLGTAEVL